MKRNNFISHLSAAIIISGILLFNYASVQQVYRSMANDPQLQIANDISNAIEQGKSYSYLIRPDTIEINKSSSVFTVIYNEEGAPMQTSALLDGKIPKMPKGVLEFTRQYCKDVITWQPREGVRLAVVVAKVTGIAKGFVLVGRSLKETEIRTGELVTMMLITWAFCLGILGMHFGFIILINKRNKN